MRKLSRRQLAPFADGLVWLTVVIGGAVAAVYIDGPWWSYFVAALILLAVLLPFRLWLHRSNDSNFAKPS